MLVFEILLSVWLLVVSWKSWSIRHIFIPWEFDSGSKTVAEEQLTLLSRHGLLRSRSSSYKGVPRRALNGLSDITHRCGLPKGESPGPVKWLDLQPLPLCPSSQGWMENMVCSIKIGLMNKEYWERAFTVQGSHKRARSSASCIPCPHICSPTDSLLHTVSCIPALAYSLICCYFVYNVFCPQMCGF